MPILYLDELGVPLKRESTKYDLTFSNNGDSNESGKNEYEEGNEKLRLHKIRKRTLIKEEKKKRFKKKHGQLFCEACGINFEKVYGERGKDFIEGHHKKRISEMSYVEMTKVEHINLDPIQEIR